MEPWSTRNGAFAKSSHCREIVSESRTRYGKSMPRIVRCSLIQATNVSPAKAMVDKHLAYIGQAADSGAQIVCLQEIFNGPYFCAEQEIRWYDVAEAVPDGPIIRLMQEEARRRRIALIVPGYAREQEGVYYNTAATIGKHCDVCGN